MNHDEAMAHVLAGEKRWMQLLCDGSYTMAKAAELMSPSTPDPAQVLTRCREGETLAFEHEGELWFPKYQFARGSVLPVIPQLLTVARDAAATDTDLALWMIAPSSLFGNQGAPVAHLGNPALVVEAAHLHLEALWWPPNGRSGARTTSATSYIASWPTYSLSRVMRSELSGFATSPA